LHHRVSKRKEAKVKSRYQLIIVAFVVSACGGMITLKTDYDPTTDFAKYHSVAVKPGNSSGNPVMDQRVLADVAEALQAKGYRIVPEDQADAIAFVHAATRDKHTYQVFYDGWPGWGWRFGWAAPVVEEYDFTVGSLIVDIFDASMKRAIWHGSATDVVLGDPEHDARKIQQAITKLLQRFPPRARNT
jgi:hypothetical protein